MMPITTWFKQYGSHKTARASGAKPTTWGLPLEAAIDEARVIMRARRHDAPGAEG